MLYVLLCLLRGKIWQISTLSLLSLFSYHPIWHMVTMLEGGTALLLPCEAGRTGSEEQSITLVISWSKCTRARLSILRLLIIEKIYSPLCLSQWSLLFVPCSQMQSTLMGSSRENEQLIS